MAKQPISVTLRTDNLTWLRARVGAVGARSVSELIDQLVTDARTSNPAGRVTSVVGTIDLDPLDPELHEAEGAVRDLFRESMARPAVVKEARTTYSPKPKGRRRG